MVRNNPKIMQNLLFFISSRKQGVCVVLVKHAIEIAKNDLNVICYGSTTEQEEGLYNLLDFNGIKYYKDRHFDVSKNILFIVGNIYKLIRICKSKQIDIIHCNGQFHTFCALFIKLFYRKIRIVSMIHSVPGKFYRQPYRVILNCLYKVTNCVIVQTLKQEKLPFLENCKIKIAHLGVEINSSFLPTKRVDEIKERAEGKVKIIQIGDFNENKNYKMLLKALKKMDQSERDKYFVILLGNTGHLKDVTESQLKTLKIKYWIGKITNKEVHNILSFCNIAVVTSKRETFGYCIAEPLSHQIPVISTDVGIASQYLKTIENGIIIKDENELLSAIRKISEKNLLVDKNISEELSTKNCAKKFVEIYTNL